MDAQAEAPPQMAQDSKDDALWSSYKVSEMIRDFTPQEIAVAKSASYSYLMLLETIAMIRKHRKRGGHI